MIATLRNIVLTAAALLVSLALASCSSNSADIPSVPETHYSLGFYLTVGDAMAGSRANTNPQNPGFLSGSEWENYIDINDMRVVLYDDTDNPKPLQSLTDFIITPIGLGTANENEQAPTLYYLNVSTTADISSGNFRIMVLANWGKKEDGTPNYPDDDWALENVWAQTFKFDPAQRLSETNLIPFFGIKKCKVNGGIKPGIVADLGKIQLLRSLAKVEVRYDVSSTFDIESVELLNYNTVGRCAPYGVKDESDYFHGYDWDNDFTKDPSIPDEPGLVSDKDGSVWFTEIRGKGIWYAYVPEFLNKGISDGYRSVVRVTLRGGDEIFVAPDKKVNLIEFQFNVRNQKNVQFDIMRNYWYRFNVKKTPATFEVEADVLPYHVIELEPDFGLNPDTQTETSAE